MFHPYHEFIFNLRVPLDPFIKLLPSKDQSLYFRLSFDLTRGPELGQERYFSKIVRSLCLGNWNDSAFSLGDENFTLHKQVKCVSKFFLLNENVILNEAHLGQVFKQEADTKVIKSLQQGDVF